MVPTNCRGASGALLLGESMAPLAAVFISTASELALKVPEQAAATLFEAQAFAARKQGLECRIEAVSESYLRTGQR